MNKTVIVLAICFAFMVSFITSAPPSVGEASKYSQYNYDYRVEDGEKKLFFDKTESGDESGKVCKERVFFLRLSDK